MFSFPTSMAMMTEESRVELEGPVAFVAAPVRASRGRSGTFVPVRQSDLADPRSFACVFSPVSARRTFEPRTIDWRSWETIAASPRCRDEASRAARDARTRLWNARLFRDEPFTYHVRKPEKKFPTVKSRVRGFSKKVCVSTAAIQTEKSSKQKNNVSRKIRAAETMSGAKCVDFISERVRCTYGSYEKTRSSAPPVFGLLRSDARGGVLVTDPRR